VRLLSRPLVAIALFCLNALAAAQDAPPRSAGQSLYLPIYSHLYHGDVHPRTGKPSETLVSTHVSIRNIDPGPP
jgi:hypothetical protein